MSKYKELVKKLKEIFQIDRPELDFGIYRILNAKGDEINDYLENTLKKKISDALAIAGNANKEELEKQLSTAIKAAEDAGFDAEDSPKVKDLRQQIIATSQGANEHENAVFTHMLSFFSRYYDSGDFVSKRRYKGDTYAIPYAGEEVMLHWANKDQYYIKSGENFANYSFKLEDGRKVSFKLLTADTAKDNRKDNDADRRFVLIEPHVRTKLDDEGNEYEEEYLPVSVKKSGEVEELAIQFEYKAVKKGTKQEALVEQALQTLLANEQVQSNWVDITSREPTEKNPNRTLLEKHLTTYTQRNTADYFIHKDLGGFLSNELDFYIKNEVMNLDNVQNAEVFADIEKQLRMIQCFRAISSDVIKFLAQLEDFQKKLWEKKKFYTSVNYLISLDRLDETLLSIIEKNDRQWIEWQRLNLVSPSISNRSDYLKLHKNLIIDTSLFQFKYKEEIINSLSNIDSELTGEIINSDNLQAISLIKKKYHNKIDCIYIDPPYNAKSSEILYKNTFKNSSFASFIYDRLVGSKSLMKDGGIINLAIDDYEQKNVAIIMEQIYGKENFISNVVVVHNPRGRNDDKFYGTSHEYMIAYSNNKDNANLGLFNLSADDIKLYNKKDEISAFSEVSYMRTGNNSEKHERPNLHYPIFVCTETLQLYLESGSNRVAILPINGSGEEKTWRWGKDTFSKLCATEISVKPFEQSFKLYKKRRITGAGKKPKSVWTASNYDASSNGIMYLRNILGKGDSFSYPKSINTVKDALSISCDNNSIILDFFAGSGTTADAVIRLNIEDNGNRKFILVEQGAYFETVIKPRIIKLGFSDQWKNTQLIAGVSTSLLVKVLGMENYEDALNNIELKKKQQTTNLFDSLNEEAKSDYLLNYMLDIESKGTLLSTDDFKKPFDYKMKIAVDSSGASEVQNIDLVETFNYLIGLHVNTIESNIERGYVRIEGKLPSGERALVLWRDCEKIQYDDFTKFASRFDLFAKQKTFDVIYVNGDHNLPTAFTNDEGEVTRTLKLRQIEPEFLEQMFAPDDLA